MATPHVHKDRKKLSDRVEAFADSSLAQQRLALAELRVESADRDGPTYLTIVAIVVPVALVLSPVTPIEGNPWGAALVIGIAGIPFAIALFVAERVLSRSQRTALMWLRAYEDELARRQLMRGSSGRKWRRSH
ncbi:hypothetical protein [Homoserinibacter sp. YIM 151385]|uniref:hypothetical protein n=1 Tax=Homoserinibacter sp. YIM 151385 TaxID=2985506 RepID=UPI0022F0E039|nr:hypothetical protein [Homoserinibacter sp. YIM 151385]WBU36710.1 hypothetical protein OF852_07105 [Homoserinibacter sp. YIM 151385]